VELGFEKLATMLIAPLEGPNGKLAGALKTYPSSSYVPSGHENTVTAVTDFRETSRGGRDRHCDTTLRKVAIEVPSHVHLKEMWRSIAIDLMQTEELDTTYQCEFTRKLLSRVGEPR
jgi:hypothetical protein